MTWIIVQSLFLHTANHQYGLLNRRHNYILNIKRVTDERNFITRMLFIEYMYWLLFYSFSTCFYFYLPLYTLRFVNYLLNEDDDDDDDRQIDLMFSQRSPSLAAILGLQYTCVTKVFKIIDVMQKAINVNSAGNLSIYVSNTQTTICGSSR